MDHLLALIHGMDALRAGRPLMLFFETIPQIPCRISVIPTNWNEGCLKCCREKRLMSLIDKDIGSSSKSDLENSP